MPRVIYTVISVSLNRLSNSLNVSARECSCIEILGAFLMLAFEGITVGVDFVWDKFIDIEEGSSGASVFQGRKTLELRVDCKLKGFVFHPQLN